MVPKNILVLGVDNILLRDEGLGVRVVEKMQQNYVFSPNVRLLDGGTLGLKLLEPIMAADHLIVVDAVKYRQPPGTIARLSLAAMRKRIAMKKSPHQLDLLETLAHAAFLESQPDTVIIGIEPEDTTTLSLELSKTVRSRLEDLMRDVLREIAKLGGGYYPRPPDAVVGGAFWQYSQMKPATALEDF